MVSIKINLSSSSYFPSSVGGLKIYPFTQAWAWLLVVDELAELSWRGSAFAKRLLGGRSISKEVEGPPCARVLQLPSHLPAHPWLAPHTLPVLSLGLFRQHLYLLPNSPDHRLRQGPSWSPGQPWGLGFFPGHTVMALAGTGTPGSLTWEQTACIWVLGLEHKDPRLSFSIRGKAALHGRKRSPNHHKTLELV